MLSSTSTISSKNSTMNNNDRKRPISSSIRPSPSPPLAKRHDLSSTKKHLHYSERNEILLKKTTDHNERQSRSKQQYRHIDNKSSSSESSHSSSNSNHSINQEYLSSSTLRTFHDSHKSTNSNEILLTKKPHLNSINNNYQLSDLQTDTIYTKNSNKILTKSTHVVVPSSLMTIVTTPDLTKKSIRTDNVIIQQLDGNINSNSSTKLVKLVVPKSTNSSSSIKMLSSGDGFTSALRVPTKIQLTKTLFVSSTKNDKNSSLSIDIPINMTEKQQSIVDYNSSTTLPPTPPPPIIDNTNSNLRIHQLNNQQEEQQKIHENSTINIKEINSSTINEHSNHQIKSKRHSLNIDYSSSLSDWSVPPTSELSPTSLTSSSPDLTQNLIPIDDSLIEFDSKINFKRSKKHLSSSCPILPSLTISYLQRNKIMKSKSLTNLTNMKYMLIHNKRSLTSSPIIKLSSSQRIKKRRRDNENLILNQQYGKIFKSKTKHIKIEYDNNYFIIKNLLNDIIERIISTNDNTLKTLLIKPVSQLKQTISIDVIPNRQTKTEILLRTPSINKKIYSSSQSLDSTIPNESRSMIMTHEELDELAYLLHANVHRANYERINNPTKVEERMREMWSQMSNQKKNSYYKRVIQIYKRPNRDVIIASSSSTNENNSLLSNDLIDSINPLSIELKRQTSTPLSFHSIPSSTTDEQSIISPEESSLKTNIFTDIVNELIKGAKSLDKLSCSLNVFINSIHNFVRSTIDKQIQIVKNLERQLEKKCSIQLNRANIFCTQKINYFSIKYQINSSNESINELTLIIKYFYLFVLSLNCRKQEIEFESILTDLLNGNLTLINQSFCSPILTSIIEDLILRSSLANDYLASQFLIINEIEYSLPLIRNNELEYELLNKNDIYLSTNPFSDFNDLEDYLNRCEHITTTIPCYPIQQSHHSSMYYPTYHPPPLQYYYPSSSSSDINNYYYNPTTIYPYGGQSTSYYHPSTTYNNNNNNNNEQFKYYYNQQQSLYTYPSQTNSTNDIPLANNPSLHRTYRQINPNIQRTYSNSQQPATPGAAPPTPTTPSTPAVFDTTTVVSPQSKSMNTTNNNYPP